MSNPVSIRKAVIDDFDQAIRLYAELVGHEKVDFGDTGLVQWKTVLEHPGTTVFCSELDDHIVGVTTLHVLPNTTYLGRPYALIENVVTLKRLQGQGLGRQLMEHVIDVAWQQDCYKIMLLTGQHVGARGLYERLGFSADEKFGMTLRRVPVRQK